MLPARRAPSMRRSTRSAGVCDPFGTSSTERHDSATAAIGTGFARTTARSISIGGADAVTTIGAAVTIDGADVDIDVGVGTSLVSSTTLADVLATTCSITFRIVL